MRYVSTRGAGARARLRRRAARRPGQPTAGCTCPSAWPALPPLLRPGRAYAERGRRGDAALRRRRHRRARRFDAAVRPTRTPRSATRPCARSCSSTTTSGCSSCSTARRSRSRTSPCSSSAGCSTTCSTERGERVDDRRGDVGRHRLGGHRRRARAARTSTSSILYPAGRVSEVQRRQMTTVDAAERARRRRRGHVRRLPGPREGDVHRRRVPRARSSCRR